MIFTEEITKDHQIYFKCIKAKLPQTQAAIFVDTNIFVDPKNVVLKYLWDEQDPRYDDHTGYSAASIGDSGGPYWTYDTIYENDLRAVAVAVHNAGNPYVNIESDKDFQCRIRATKITDDILDWLKKKSGII